MLARSASADSLEPPDASCAASSGLASDHAANVSFHAACAAAFAFACSAKYAFTSSETKNPLSGRPRPSLAESAKLAPPSPCPLAVPATSGMPLAMSVLAMMTVGLPLVFAFEAFTASATAVTSWPSMTTAFQPCDSKYFCDWSPCVTSAMASSVTSLLS